MSRFNFNMSPLKDKDVILNEGPYECQWYTDQVRNPKKIKDCGFSKFNITNPSEQSGSIVTIPAGTVLYHATISFINKNNPEHWFTKTCPKKKFVWFTTTIDHSNYHNYNFLLAYVLKEPLRLRFIQKLNVLGNEYVKKLSPKSIQLESISEKDEEEEDFVDEDNEYDLMEEDEDEEDEEEQYFINEEDEILDGYIGCNECEIAIRSESIQRKFKKFVAATPIKYKDELCEFEIIKQSKYIN